MKNFASVLFAVFMATITLCGCSDSGNSSVTEGVEQSAIDEYKANEAKLNAEMEETNMDLE